MKKIAIISSLLALGACTGYRGIEQDKRTCIHHTFFGLSLEEQLKPCTEAKK